MVTIAPIGYSILTRIDKDHIFKDIERAARTCYKSEALITQDSADKLVKNLVERGHWAMIEHAIPITVRIIGDRGVSHELVRHRLASFAQESTRFINYLKTLSIQFIVPEWFYAKDEQREILLDVYDYCEKGYNKLIGLKTPPEIARSVLPIGIRAEIVITANMREWKHIFSLRTTHYAHPTIRAIMKDIQHELRALIPYIFD